MTLLWTVLKLVCALLSQYGPPVKFTAQLELDLVECRDHQYKQLVGPLAPLHPLLGVRNFLLDLYPAYTSLLPLV